MLCMCAGTYYVVILYEHDKNSTKEYYFLNLLAITFSLIHLLRLGKRLIGVIAEKTRLYSYIYYSYSYRYSYSG